LFPLWCWGQTSGALSAVTPAKVDAKPGETVIVTLHLRLGPGYHVNSNAPMDDYLIPLRLTWEAGPLEVVSVEYPKGHLERYTFSEKPLSVYTGDFDVRTRFKAPEKAPKGARKIAGKVRYQACTQTMCFPPRSLNVEVPIEIR
jgi:thiol:disulfide interchange protein DsbD